MPMEPKSRLGKDKPLPHSREQGARALAVVTLVALYPSFDGFEKGLRFLYVREVAALLEDHQLRVGDALVHDLRSGGGADEVVFAHDDECWRGDLAQPRSEVPLLYEGIALLLGRTLAPGVGLYLIPVLEVRCGAEQDKVAEVLGVAQCVLQSDTSSEGVAEDGDLLEAQVIAQGVGISAQPLEGNRLRRWSARAPVAAVVVVDQMHHAAQRVEPGV